MAANDSIASVLGPEFRRPFALIVAICASCGVLLYGVAAAEGFVDGRIEMKMAEQRREVDGHEKRLSKGEEKLVAITEVLSEIRADVKVLRARMER